MNRYKPWQYLLILMVLLVGALYALPNLYGKDPAVQISALRGAEVGEGTVAELKSLLDAEQVDYKSIALEGEKAVVRLEELSAQERVANTLNRSLGDRYTVALNLADATPQWLRNLGAAPMVLGLDLQGGVHFLLEVDMDAARRSQSERYVDDVRTLLRNAKIRYRAVTPAPGGVTVQLRSAEDVATAESIIEGEIVELSGSTIGDPEDYRLRFAIAEVKLQELARTALKQNITTLRNRVNELGVAEPIVQQQGDSRIVVQLPGIQDTAQAKRILGGTATLEYRGECEGHSAEQAAATGTIPPGCRLYFDRAGRPALLRNELIVSGDQLVDASAGFDSQNGQPQVNIRLDNVGGNRMLEFTRDNVNKRMGVVYIERIPTMREVDGEMKPSFRETRELISLATIQGVFGKSFRTTGLDPAEATQLALQLRAGALAAPVTIIEERTVGPSLGQDNIERGFKSVVIGLALVLVFMALYYRVFGLVADTALVANIVLIVALLSAIGATLTLPGIAGIVLTVGMAVDANVLIFERIREELRNGSTPQAAIKGGYEKAFSTIADANVTTLIAAIVLFQFGTGPIKGFAVTLSLGIVTSMFTAIIGTRALVNLIYGRRARVRALAI